MEEYERGTIIELYENSEQKYLILNNVEIENNNYLLTMPIEDLKKIEINYSKMILLKYNKSSKKIGFEKNEDIIKQVIEETSKLLDN